MVASRECLLPCEDKAVSEVLAFSAEQVCRLTGLSARQLRYWDDTEFFPPAFREDVKRSPFARVYSFRDVVGLRALSELRGHYRIPLQTLRRVGDELGRRCEAPWSELTLYIVGKRVFYQSEHDAATRSADRLGQQLMPFELVKVEGSVREGLSRLRVRDEEQVGKISRHRHVAENQPVVAGTRIPTRAIWEFHQADYSMSAILRAYPQLQTADVTAAIDFEQARRTQVA